MTTAAILAATIVGVAVLALVVGYYVRHRHDPAPMRAPMRGLFDEFEMEEL